MHHNVSLERCIDLCQDPSQCLGYSYSERNRSCGISLKFERFERMEGFVSGRKCTNCELREWIKVRLFQRKYSILFWIRSLVRSLTQSPMSAWMIVSISVARNPRVPSSTSSTVKSRQILGPSALLYIPKGPPTRHLSTLIM